MFALNTVQVCVWGVHDTRVAVWGQQMVYRQRSVSVPTAAKRGNEPDCAESDTRSCKSRLYISDASLLNLDR